MTTWADHDALVHYLIGPMIAADAAFLSRPPRWAKARKRWHQRAAAVSLIHSTRQHKNFADIQRITEMLLTSDDDMVQKGLGWLLREAAKANPRTDRRVPDDHTRSNAAAGVTDGMRNGAYGHTNARVGEKTIETSEGRIVIRN